MSAKQILFRDLAGRDLVGCWVEQCCVGNKNNLGNTRFIVKAFTATPSSLCFERRGELKYDESSREWRVKGTDRGMDYFFCRPAEDYYTGPFELDSGEIVWLFGSFANPHTYGKIYPKGFEPPNTPIKPEDFQILAEKFG